MKSKRILVLILLLVTVVAGVGAVYVGQVLQQQSTTPTDTAAASAQVWDAELLKNQTQRDAFAASWKAIDGRSFAEKKAFVDKGGARFKSDTDILHVGTETLYGRDLNYYMFLLQYDVYTSSRVLTDADVDKGLGVLINNSLILQKAQELGLTPLDSSVFNSVNKDFRKRNELVTQMIPQVSKYFVDTAEGEAIAIAFNNNFIPVSVEEGRKIAKAKIDELYTKVTTGKLTMLQAASEIANDKEILTKVDPAAVSNSYDQFTAEKGGDQVFIDPAMNDSIFSLGEGQYSQVLVAKNPVDPTFGDQSGKEYAFMIIKVNKRSFATAFGSTQDLFNKAPDQSIKSGTSVINIKHLSN